MDLTSIGLVVAIVMRLSEVFKRLELNSKLIPILNLILGIVTRIVYSGLGIKEGIAGEFYSETKNTIENFKG
ncbi:hypothetical protein HAHI6034_02710 [Hathewaya histolytica]|uniref:Holin n=1 Tax=Hathewaya histolytica TaxID=1498 RepID=A0A4U9RNU8_HATHI|nr:hypothetical protein [Hathewaya histolytica]VTQ90530.1 Uncharacterised protein [Hathewaya histolytica]